MKQKLLFGASNVTEDSAKQSKSASSVKKRKFTKEDAAETWLTKRAATTAEADVSSDETQQDEEKNNGKKTFSLTYEEMDKDFMQFLESQMQNESNSIFKAATIRYMIKGPPFKGRHSTGFKTALNGAGAKWLKNEHREESQRYDPDNPYGWYVACSVHDLKQLASLLCKKDGERAWFPYGIDDENGNLTCRLIREICQEFEDEKQAKLELQRRQEAKRRSDLQDKNRQDAIGRVLPDTQEEIEKLVQFLSVDGHVWKYDSSLIRSSCTSDRLGPAMRTNAQRVIRGLHHKILTPHDVRKGDFEGFDRRIENSLRMKAEKRRMERMTASNSNSKTQTAVSSTDDQLTFNNKLETVKDSQTEVVNYLLSDAQLEMIKHTEEFQKKDEEIQEETRLLKMNRTLVLNVRVETTCKTCKQIVDEQFGCECYSLKWSTCRKCLHATCASQACVCVLHDM